jgi:hypothetical protein
MDADGGKDVRVQLAQRGGHRAAGGESRDIDAPRIAAMLCDHGLHQRRDHRRLTGAAFLVLRLEPVPAPHLVGLAQLFRIEHQETFPRRHLVHAGASREVLGVLLASVQHHDHRQQCRVGPGGFVEPITPAMAVVREEVRGEGHGARLGRVPYG